MYFEADEEFGRVARFDEWKRKYTWFGFGSEVVKIYPDERVNTYIQFFSNGVAKVATVGWMGSGSTDYFKIPDDVLEAVEEYIEAHKVADASE